MKLSKILHVLSIIAGFLGVLALIGAWLAGENGTVLGFSQQHCFYDAIVLVLVAIWLQLATMHHMMLEKHHEVI
ncbi:MAG: hypothetical protein Q8L64_05830 [bacterium]|nr:hypothetical protein [bacterium]